MAIEIETSRLRVQKGRPSTDAGGRLCSAAGTIAILALGVAGIAQPAAARPAAPASYDGVWKADFPCVASELGPNSPYAERCAQGVEDYFKITLRSEGKSLCGTHAATAHLGNRVDEDEDTTPSLLGQITGAGALVAFHSHWGGNGHARISIKGGRLYWDVVDQDSGVSWIPDDAVLTRWVDGGPARPLACPDKLDTE